MTTIETSIDRFTTDPAAGRTAPKVTARLNSGRAELTAGPFTWGCDLPPGLGGTNQFPSPTAYLLGALAGCGVAFIHDTLAAQFDVELTDVSATASCSADLGGLLGIDGTLPNLADLRVEISISTPSPRERVDALQQAWLDRCPIYLALRDANEVDPMFTVDG